MMMLSVDGGVLWEQICSSLECRCVLAPDASAVSKRMKALQLNVGRSCEIGEAPEYCVKMSALVNTVKPR
jgi:hypothetical protein